MQFSCLFLTNGFPGFIILPLFPGLSYFDEHCFISCHSLSLWYLPALSVVHSVFPTVLCCLFSLPPCWSVRVFILCLSMSNSSNSLVFTSGDGFMMVMRADGASTYLECVLSPLVFPVLSLSDHPTHLFLLLSYLSQFPLNSCWTPIVHPLPLPLWSPASFLSPYLGSLLRFVFRAK